MIIRTAANEADVVKATAVHMANEPGQSSTHAQQTREQWLATFASCPEGFWVAEDERSQQIVGIASAIRRPPQWLLTNFYVHPAYHGQGIGQSLLAKAIAVCEGCDRFAVHASQHPSAQRLYMQYGMYPLPHSIMFKGRPVVPLSLPAALTTEAVSPGSVLPTLDSIDLNALGFTRAVDHQWFGTLGSYYLVKADGKTVGYFRVSTWDSIGPLVVNDTRWMAGALDLAIDRQLAITAGDHEIFVPGANRTAIAHLLARGYRFRDIEILLSSHPMPGLERVIFHDTDFL